MLAALAGCASAPSGSRAGLDDEARACLQQFEETDRQVRAAGVRDGGDAAVRGFPYVRVTRPLAALEARAENETQWRVWAEHMRMTDLRARRAELRNLDAAQADARWRRLDECGRKLVEVDARDARRRTMLRQAARVPDDYATWQRAAGLYALSRIPFAAGVRDYQRKTEAVFSADEAALPIQGRLRRYGVALGSASEAHESLPVDALGVPVPDPQHLARLFERHAPVWDVDESGEHDRIGMLVWRNRVEADTRLSVVYQRSVFTHYHGRIFLQLVYTVWFPSRPSRGALDLLAGNLDGLIWRVTLDQEGEALMYDTIHPCGCYHQFFPTPRARLKPAPDTLDEYAFVPQRLPAIEPGQRLRLRVAARGHYLQRVMVEAAPVAVDAPLAVMDDDEPRALAQGGGFRSVYDWHGLIRGSERLERLLFWPMGARSAGAMRQYGRQATAFVGRRHFDEARLLERYFEFEGIK